MFVLIWLAGPVTVAALLALVTRIRWDRAYILFGGTRGGHNRWPARLRLHAPPDYQHSHGDEDGEMYWGRWWEPQWTSIVAMIGYLFWALGTSAGLPERRERLNVVWATALTPARARLRPRA